MQVMNNIHNLLPEKCSGQSRYGRYGSYATALSALRVPTLRSFKPAAGMIQMGKHVSTALPYFGKAPGSSHFGRHIYFVNTGIPPSQPSFQDLHLDFSVILQMTYAMYSHDTYTQLFQACMHCIFCGSATDVYN